MQRSLWGLGFLLLAPSVVFSEEIITVCKNFSGWRYTLDAQPPKSQKDYSQIALVRKQGQIDVLLRDAQGNDVFYMNKAWTHMEVAGTNPHIKTLMYFNNEGWLRYYTFRLDKNRNGFVVKGNLQGASKSLGIATGIYGDPEPYTELLTGVCRSPKNGSRRE